MADTRAGYAMSSQARHAGIDESVAAVCGSAGQVTRYFGYLGLPTMNLRHQKTLSVTIVYDGMCHLCSGSIAWIARRVAADCIQFTPVQSAEGAQALRAAGLNALDPKSFLVINNGKYLVKSAAVIAALNMIGGRWKVIAWLLNLLPASFADKIYDWVAANRYKWFGRRETCFIRQ